MIFLVEAYRLLCRNDVDKYIFSAQKRLRSLFCWKDDFEGKNKLEIGKDGVYG